MSQLNVMMLDIETVPAENCRDYIEGLQIFPDAKYQAESPPQSILSIKTDELREQRLAEWTANKQHAQEQDVLQKKQKLYETAGLKWWIGKVICICIRHNGNKATWYGDDEAANLRGLFDYLMDNPDAVVGGKQTSDFDIPFLIGRALHHNLGIPHNLRTPYQIRDINFIFGNSHVSGQRGKLSDYAFGIGVKPKTAHGSDMIAMHDQASLTGDWSNIIDYCSQDVAIASEVFDRYSKEYRRSE